MSLSLDEISVDIVEDRCQILIPSITPTTMSTISTSSQTGLPNSNKLDLNHHGLKYLPKWPPVNIEFQDVVYTVPDLNGHKVILRGVSGVFKSGQLTAILGPSGAGKSTLLNVMAGYRTSETSGNILINGKPRDMRLFRKMSRYIMQESLFQPMLTVRESMNISADLKLGNDLNRSEKDEVINEILDLLRLTKSADTMGHRLSGGELKRLSIALELVNNPPVIFLDEPTTGLDDLSCLQCINLLKRIAQGGRTIICSVHTPSAKLFSLFDHVYVVANGQCVYQGNGSQIVPYMQEIGLSCPLTYNPADFVIEVSCGEYGADHIEKMVTLIENGKCHSWQSQIDRITAESNERELHFNENDDLLIEEIDPHHLRARSSSWYQFKVLFNRRTIQMFRDSSYMKLKIFMHIFLAVIVSGIYQGVGNDATKALFNFGFCFTVALAFMYNPMMPVLLTFPAEIELVKREHFNRWFRIGPYFMSMLLAKFPIHMLINVAYITAIYFASDQPIEWDRMFMFYTISILIAITSESLGTLLSSRLSLVNGMFVGPVITVPMMLLGVYGVGFGSSELPIHVRILMSLSYVRYGVEGIVAAIYGYNRGDTICPENEIFCMFKSSDYLKNFLGFRDADFFVSVSGLMFFYILFTVSAFFMIKMRVSSTGTQYVAVQYIGQFVKTHLNFSSYKY